MSPARPKMVGSTALGDPLGAGGMSEVFLGVQEPLERKVAVKALLPDLKENAEAVARFRREALALAALQHENIVGVHDLVEKNNRLYLIMEFVDGVDLATVLKGGPLPLDIVLLIGSALAGALEHSHFRRVIHRDIKPSNVMLSRVGQVKLTDFGIAKDQTKEDLTKFGMVVGTPNYLSPEQARGERADWRSDIFALGVLLFELLTGKKPHQGKDYAELLLSIATGKRQRLREAAPRLPRAVERIVNRCLQVDPAKRYQRASDLRRDLDRLLAAILEGTPSARLVAFLQERGQVGRESLTLIADDELAAVKVVTSPATVLKNRSLESAARPSGPWRRVLRVLAIVLLTLLLLFGGMVAGYWVAPDWFRGVVSQVNVWVAAEPTGGLASDR